MSEPLLRAVMADALRDALISAFPGRDANELLDGLAADPRTVEAIAEALHDRAGTHSVRPTRMLCDGPRHHMRDAGVIRDALFGRPK